MNRDLWIERCQEVHGALTVNRSALLNLHGGRCWMCLGRLTILGALPLDFHVDHIFPLRGRLRIQGHHSALNLAPACVSCNTKKGVRSPWNFARMNDARALVKKAEQECLRLSEAHLAATGESIFGHPRIVEVPYDPSAQERFSVKPFRRMPGGKITDKADGDRRDV